MQISDIKTLHVEITKWFDKPNGNTYFSGYFLINNQERIFLPFQYGYERYYEESTFQELKKMFSLQKDLPLWKFCNENAISYTENVVYTTKRNMIKA